MRNQQIANGIFACSAIIFGIAFYIRLHDDSFGSSLFYFIAQSACIGGAADWFAVTALFRKPLGFPLHTALIPKNRGRIISSIRSMLEKKLVRPAMWEGWIQGFSATEAFGYFQTTKQGTQFEKKAAAYAAKMMDQVLESDVQGFAGRQDTLRKDLCDQCLRSLKDRLGSKEAGNILFPYVTEGILSLSAQPAVRSFLADSFRQWADHQKTNPLIAMAVSMGESMGLIQYEDMADAVMEAVRAMAEQWLDEENEYYTLRKDRFCFIFADFAHSEAARAGMEVLVSAFFAQLPIENFVKHGQSVLSKQWSEEGGMVMEEVIQNTIRSVLSNQAICKKLDGEIRSLVLGLALYEHRFLGDTAVTVLQSYDDKRLNQFIENKVGEELGWIRINGSLVAAVTGALLFVAFMII